jgi:hypothetical protein
MFSSFHYGVNKKDLIAKHDKIYGKEENLEISMMPIYNIQR